MPWIFASRLSVLQTSKEVPEKEKLGKPKSDRCKSDELVNRLQ
jgi:hypothetical protein